MFISAFQIFQSMPVQGTAKAAATAKARRDLHQLWEGSGGSGGSGFGFS